MSRNTQNRSKWPEIFSKWNKNTLDKIFEVATYITGYKKNINQETLILAAKKQLKGRYDQEKREGEGKVDTYV